MGRVSHQPPPPRYEFASTCMLPLLKYIYMCRSKYLYTKSLTCFYIYFVRKLFDMALGDKGPATSKELRLIVTPNLSRQVQEKFGVVVPMSYLVSMWEAWAWMSSKPHFFFQASFLQLLELQATCEHHYFSLQLLKTICSFGNTGFIKTSSLFKVSLIYIWRAQMNKTPKPEPLNTTKVPGTLSRFDQHALYTSL